MPTATPVRFCPSVFLWVAAATLGIVPVATAEIAINELTQAEEAAGWQLLFDGDDLDGWRNYQRDDVSDGWKVIDGAIVGGAGSGDLVTRDQYEWFELQIDYRIAPGGNSGVMFHVTENGEQPWHSGPEVQILDTDDPTAQQTGWLYDLIKPVPPGWVQEAELVDAARPAGEWNQLYLRVAPGDCEVSINGFNYYNFDLNSDDFKRRISESKFAKYDGFAEAGRGHLCLQDHGDRVSFRSVKIRPHDPERGTPQPITGKLGLASENAFPDLKWDRWDPTDEGGNVRPLRLLELTFPRDGSNRLFAASQAGEIWCFDNRPDVTESRLFLDMRDLVYDFGRPGANEQGLLGLAFHPNYADNGHFFTYHSDPGNSNCIISRWTVSRDDPDAADPDSQVTVMTIEEPFQNHNGGSIEFGPDGYLYIGVGDGGLRNDPLISGQDLSDLRGKILRIDVDGDSEGEYGIPTDNPFVDHGGARPEVYSYGWRNPWRLAFDPQDGRLWASDVGQNLWEEVNVVRAGGNYGWSRFEGTHPFGNKDQPAPVNPPIDPVWEYDHQIGKSITGGRVCRGGDIDALKGKYLYADYITGTIWALTYDPATERATANEQVLPKSIPVLAFGQDQNGEVYFMVTSARGQSIQRFVANTESS